MDNIQRWKILGNILFNQDKNAFIKEMNGDLHFCKILLISDNLRRKEYERRILERNT